MRVLYLTKRWSHHTQSGGYDRLARGNGILEIVRSDDRRFVLRGLRAVWCRVRRANPYLLDYTFGDFWAEHRALVAAWLTRADIVHVLYGDEQLDVLLRRRSLLPCPLIATFHLPSGRVAERFERGQAEDLQRLDGAIVVSTAQLPAFREWLGEDRVVYIPHGIDTEVFHPAPEFTPDETLRLVFVGSHMRDFTLAHRAMDVCTAEGIKVCLEVVTARNCFGHFTGCEGVAVRSGVSEGQLISLYQSADALFLPVTDATANNAVLEAMACGTPVITSDVGGMRDYVDSSAGWLLPSEDADAAVDLIRQLARDRSASVAKRKAARKRAESFSWEHVLRQCRAAYQNLLQKGHLGRVLPVSNREPARLHGLLPK